MLVQTGATNSDYVIIESGLQEGDTVALVDPTLVDQKEKEEKK